MKLLIVSILLSAGLSSGQTPVYPDYFVSAGGGYTRNVPGITEGWVSAAIGLGGGNYSITTIDMTALTSTIRTGYGKVMSQKGNWSLLGRMDAGLSTVSPVVGSFSGGGIMLYNLKGISSRLDGWHAVFEVRITGGTGTTNAIPHQVSPGFYVGIGRAL